LFVPRAAPGSSSILYCPTEHLLATPTACCCVLQGIQPEVRTYNTIITACNKSGKPEQGLKVYERMVAKGVKASATTYTALISAYGKQGMVEKAMDIFAGAVLRLESSVGRCMLVAADGKTAGHARQ
jgi:pentatricopeptide repeat protein